MNEGFRLPITALCVAGIAGLIWLVTRNTDINGLAGGIAVVSGICGLLGIAVAVMSDDKRD